MGESEMMVIDSENGPAGIQIPKQKTLKRKRASVSSSSGLTPEEKQLKVKELEGEMEGLFRYYKEVLGQSVTGLSSVGECNANSNVNVLIGLMLEESELPLTRLVDEIYEKLKGKDGIGSITMGSVKNIVITIGQRIAYGVANDDADVLEDSSETCLWCWETRDVKLMPNTVRSMLKIRRYCRKKIQERICVISAMLTTLQNFESHPSCRHDFVKASEKLSRVLNEADIRSYVDTMVRKTGANVADKEAKREEKLLIKQLEKNKREAEKEKKRMEHKMQKEKLQNEKDQQQLHADAELNREKEESEARKQRRKLQEGAEKDQRRREKEEAELKKQLAIQKQASLMERFLKKGNKNITSQKVVSLTETKTFDSSTKRSEKIPEAATSLMDTTLSLDDEMNTCDMWMSHLNSWRQLGQSIRINRRKRWGLRRVPKTELIKELKLTSREQFRGSELDTEKLSDGWEERGSDDRSYPNNAAADDCLDSRSSLQVPKRYRSRQLLQFAKSFRPAFYGVWPKKSNVVRPRHPLKKDPDLDYDVDSDEEWEEEDPGESLSDCDKDDEEESLEDRLTRVEDGEESEDGFFVPDGYLSENEGVQIDRMESDSSVEALRCTSSGKEVASEEMCLLLRQQKHLHKLTERALWKNQPLILSNLMGEKTHLCMAGDPSEAEKSEQMCFQALSMCFFPGGSPIETLLEDNLQDDEKKDGKGDTTPVAVGTVIPDADLPQIVSAIQSCSQGINKVVECLQQTFPTTPKSQLRNKVREISSFVDNHWQVKKHVLNRLGLSSSPVEKKSGSTKGISNFFVKGACPHPAIPRTPMKHVHNHSANLELNRRSIRLTCPVSCSIRFYSISICFFTLLFLLPFCFPVKFLQLYAFPPQFGS